MGTHTTLVKVYINGEVKKPGAPVDYDGPPNWKFQPLDVEQRREWAETTADPTRVEESLKQTGDWDYGNPPSDVIPVTDPRTGTTYLNIIPVEQR